MEKHTNFFEKVILIFLAVFFSSQSNSTERYIKVARNQITNFVTYIDRPTVQREGSLVKYLLIIPSGSAYEPSFAIEPSVKRYVEADCVKRTRSESMLIQNRSDSLRTYTIFEGTDQALELDIACAIDINPYKAPSVGLELPPTPKITIKPPERISDDSAKSNGSGFIISSNNTVITNFHVVDGCKKLAIQRTDGLFAATIIALDEANDLAALLPSKMKSIFLPIASFPVEIGAGVTVLGFPLASVLGTELRATTGIVSSLSGVHGDTKRMQISASVQPGNSGGPVLDEYGALIGVVVSKLAERYTAENVNFAIRVPVLKSFLELNGIEFSLAKRGPVLSVTEIVRRAKVSTVVVLCY